MILLQASMGAGILFIVVSFIIVFISTPLMTSGFIFLFNIRLTKNGMSKTRTNKVVVFSKSLLLSLLINALLFCLFVWAFCNLINLTTN